MTSRAKIRLSAFDLKEKKFWFGNLSGKINLQQRKLMAVTVANLFNAHEHTLCSKNESYFGGGPGQVVMGCDL